MCKEKQTIHYCTILSAEQWDFLLEGKFSAFRQKCLHRLMTEAVRARTVYKIKGVEIVLEVGQVAASDVELSEYLGCNRKTIGKLIDSFNRLGMLTTRTNNRTSVHTLHFLTGWYVGGVLVTNPHYVRPSATAKGQPGDVRTPLSDDLPLESVQSIVPSDCQSKVQGADSTTTFFSSLCSPDISDPSANGQAIGLSDAGRAGNTRIIVSGGIAFDKNGEESPKEMQDGTIDGVAIPNIGKRN
ncbi:hypothetical protein [Phocaeicola massiliensis]|uniref:hypothetical protein n=1 Tax=Phocaeicola massiliensis TaxID=204516 RepID=UPI00202E4F16|nr:hypothetical protein [Phocaeicola massiliensis]MCM1704444.1 hypothetical protein [Phocaeicola massiliensis]